MLNGTLIQTDLKNFQFLGCYDEFPEHCFGKCYTNFIPYLSQATYNALINNAALFIHFQPLVLCHSFSNASLVVMVSPPRHNGRESTFSSTLQVYHCSAARNTRVAETRCKGTIRILALYGWDTSFTITRKVTEMLQPRKLAYLLFVCNLWNLHSRQFGVGNMLCTKSIHLSMVNQ